MYAPNAPYVLSPEVVQVPRRRSTLAELFCGYEEEEGRAVRVELLTALITTCQAQ